MSEEMQPIDPITAAMLMGQVPDPCEPMIEISHKVLTRLVDVVEFGDQLERVEKDRLLAHLKEVLAADQPGLWAMHSPGPGEVHPMISKEEAERQAAELIALCNERCPTVPITINVIPSPFSPLEHFELLAEETIQHRNDLLEYVKTLEDAAKHKAAVLVAQENLHLQAVNCPHSINEHEVVLRFDPNQPGHNALNQLARRLSAALKPAELDGYSATVAMPAGLHPDTQDLVTRFATALAVKLHAAELKHGYSNGWKEPHWMDECRQKLIEHLAKGDPRDVAAYCAFLWHHCQSTSPIPSAQCWTYASKGMPPAPLFDSLEVIVAVQRAHNGKVYVFTTDYLNRYPIIRMDQTVQDDDNASEEITGWYYLSDDEETWHQTLADGDRVIAWQLKPAAPEVPEQVQS